MVIIISGASHTGKTNLAQKLLEKYKYPYLSIDHLKMGLIRSGHTSLTPYSSDEDLTAYLWPIVSEMIKTAIENKQNLIVEGCYVPYDYRDSFNEEYLKNIRCFFLIMSKDYIENHFNDIIKYENIIEQRLNTDITKEDLIVENVNILRKCIEHNIEYILIDDEYNINIKIGDNIV
ncbi:MAG: AAA family ATPase [Bacilli bacterium]|nr:AAA family ATPase [Bacilli bacterium]